MDRNDKALEDVACELATIPPLDFAGYKEVLRILTSKRKPADANGIPGELNTLEDAKAIILQCRHGHAGHYISVDEFLDLTPYGRNKADRISHQQKQGGGK